MPVRVFDYRTDSGNVIVTPEIRGRFMRVQPERQPLMHSHDVAGESFLVVEGTCEFTVDGEDVTCEVGQLIYVPPQVKHALHAVGDQRCTVFLTVTPHIEPTHTRYDEAYERRPPEYGTWRGGGRVDRDADPYADTATAEVGRSFLANLRGLAERTEAAVTIAEARIGELVELDPADQGRTKQLVDDIWAELREVIWQTTATERDWNELAPRSEAPSGGSGR
jgi:quercetin dioxygenase-like cupin family protein